MTPATIRLSQAASANFARAVSTHPAVGLVPRIPVTDVHDELGVSRRVASTVLEITEGQVGIAVVVVVRLLTSIPVVFVPTQVNAC